MPYKPNWNVVRAESSDCRGSVEGQSAETNESELSDDLQAVADQLADDAQHLESRFPARLRPAIPAAAASSRAASWRRTAAAVLLIGVGAGGAVLAQHLISPREVARPNARVDRHAALTAETPDQPIDPPNPAGVQEVSFDRDAPRAKLTEVEMLRIQLDAFEKVIRRLQDQLAERQKSEAQTNQLVELLRHEIDDLRRQLNNGDDPSTRE
jgi:hypothetical protein